MSFDDSFKVLSLGIQVVAYSGGHPLDLRAKPTSRGEWQLRIGVPIGLGEAFEELLTMTWLRCVQVANDRERQIQSPADFKQYPSKGFERRENTQIGH
jgi:hypothetical protein